MDDKLFYFTWTAVYTDDTFLDEIDENYKWNSFYDINFSSLSKFVLKSDRNNWILDLVTGRFYILSSNGMLLDITPEELRHHVDMPFDYNNNLVEYRKSRSYTSGHSEVISRSIGYHFYGDKVTLTCYTDSEEFIIQLNSNTLKGG